MIFVQLKNAIHKTKKKIFLHCQLKSANIYVSTVLYLSITVYVFNLTRTLDQSVVCLKSVAVLIFNNCIKYRPNASRLSAANRN